MELNRRRFQLSERELLLLIAVCALGAKLLYKLVPFADPFTRLPKLHGLSRAAVVERLGEPNSAYKFSMSSIPGELQVGLLNAYPRSNPENLNVEIEELRWQRGNYTTALWLHHVNGEWVVLDSCRWHKSVVF